MTEVPKPLDTALDLLLYAPVGLAITAAEELPRLAAKGRSRVDTQLMMAKVVGRFAVTRGRQELEKRFSPPASVMAPPTFDGRPPSTNGLRANGSEAADDATGTAVSGKASAARKAPRPEQLAIPGYDSLSASQVVQRLAGLSGGELAAVGAYEQAHRGRRTILNRIDQLQGQ